MKKRELFKVEGGKIVRLRRSCPKCGDGVFLAEHKDRLSCGACGYTEFKSKKEKPVDLKPETKEPEKPVEEKREPEPIEQPEEKPTEEIPPEKPKEEKE